MNFQFKEQLQRFCNHYHIKILSDARRYPIFVKNKFFDVPNDLSIINTEPVTATEPLYTLEIPASKLTALAELESVFFNNATGGHGRHIFETIMDQLGEEKMLRHNYPAVQDAYEKYSLMLNLCRTTPKTMQNWPENS